MIAMNTFWEILGKNQLGIRQKYFPIVFDLESFQGWGPWGHLGTFGDFNNSWEIAIKSLTKFSFYFLPY